jgi:hypothetical protein
VPFLLDGDDNQLVLINVAIPTPDLTRKIVRQLAKAWAASAPQGTSLSTGSRAWAAKWADRPLEVSLVVDGDWQSGGRVLALRRERRGDRITAVTATPDDTEGMRSGRCAYATTCQWMPAWKINVQHRRACGTWGIIVATCSLNRNKIGRRLEEITARSYWTLDDRACH